MQFANKFKFNIPKRIVFVFIIIVLTVIIGTVAAKYIVSETGQNLLHSKLFYFSSDLLGEDNPKYVLNSSLTEITFKIGNNKDKLNYAEIDINYTVSAVCDGVEICKKEGVLEKNILSTADITLSGLEKGKKYIITATGENGYTKTLTAELTVADDEQNVYKHLDTSDPAFVVLTVWTKNIAGRVNVSVPDGLIADNTETMLEHIDNFEDPNYVAFDFEDTTNFTNTYSSYTYRFFKSNSNSYGANDFDVVLTKNDTLYTATEATP